MLKSPFQFIIHIDCDVLWGPFEIIHKILEGNVSRLLEPHVVVECLRNYLVNLFF